MKDGWMMKKVKILFFIHQLNSGGSQRILLNLVSNIDKNKYEVVLVVINNVGEFSSFSHSSVKLIDLKVKKVRNSILKIFNTIKIEEPDIIFSGISYLSLLFALLIPFLKIGRKIKFIARETNTLSIDNEGRKYTRILNFLYKKLYKNFDLIVCQSEYMKKDLFDNYNIKNNKMAVINNPVHIEQINKKLEQEEKSLFDNNKINLIAVGRLHKDKGFDLLLRVLKELDDNYHLAIIGEGKEKVNLMNLAKELNISSRVDFLGFKENPYIYMKQSDLFILSSRHEGFPNVVLEANICGTPVIAFECPGVSDEIIINGLNGFLVECKNIEEMKNKILYSQIYRWKKQNIYNYINEKFEISSILNKYENVLKI